VDSLPSVVEMGTAPRIGRMVGALCGMGWAKEGDIIAWVLPSSFGVWGSARGLSLRIFAESDSALCYCERDV
jgi:hypothetical protein